VPGKAPFGRNWQLSIVIIIISIIILAAFDGFGAMQRMFPEGRLSLSIDEPP
jgi:hypothetical protein